MQNKTYIIIRTPSGLLILLLGCILLPLHSLKAQIFNPKEDGPYVEAARAVTAEISRKYLDNIRTPENDSLAVIAINKVSEDLLSEDYLNVSAEVVFKSVDLAQRLPERRKIVNQLAERCYALESKDTSVARTASFLHAMSVLELGRLDFEAGLLFADSLLALPNDKLPRRALAGNYTVRGYCNEGLGRIKDAQLDFLNAAMAFKSIPNEERRMVSVLNASARASDALNNISEALNISEKAIQQLNHLERSGKKMDTDYQVYRTHAVILAKLNRPKEALRSAQKALGIASAKKEVIPIARCQHTLGKVYGLIGQPYKCTRYFEFAKKSFREKKAPGELLLVLEDEVKILADLGQFKKAFFLKNNYLILKDSLAALSQKGRILDIRDELETKKVRQELALAKAEQFALETQQDLDRNQMIVMLFILFFFVSAIMLLYFQLTNRKRAQVVLEETVTDRTASLEQKAEELNRYALELKRSNNELERFAFVASHDLKTPIRNINSFLNLIKRRKDTCSKEELEEYIDIAITYGNQLHCIVKDILEFSRIGTDISLISKPIELNVFFRNIKTQLSPTLSEKNASIEISGNAEVKAPEGYLAQVFTNLINNGLKYNEAPFPRIKIDIHKTESNTISIQVSDNGIGIAPEYQEQIFEMFKRLHTHDEYEGTGLGLAVCKKVLDRLGGNISVKSERGRGSNFIIEIPADQTDASAKKESTIFQLT